MMSNASPEVQALFEFVRKTPMQYAYQMLLLLAMLRADPAGRFSQEEVVEGFDRFYRRREELGLPLERQRGSKQVTLTRKNLSNIIKNGPFPRFERRGFLSLSGDKSHFEIQPELWRAMTPADGSALRALAIDRLVTHFGEERQTIEELVGHTFGQLSGQ